MHLFGTIFSVAGEFCCPTSLTLLCKVSGLVIFRCGLLLLFITLIMSVDCSHVDTRCPVSVVHVLHSCSESTQSNG